MLETLKEIILDAQEEPFKTGVKRRLHYERVKGKAFICMGVRRSGKSTLLYQIMADLRAKGVSPKNILYVNFFDDRLAELRQGNAALVLEAYFSLFPEKKGKETIYCFFDEIQEVKNWEPFVDRLMRQEKCEVFITGSSANMLSKEIATQMRGRSLAWELFPFSFGEYLDYRGVEARQLTSKNRFILKKHFKDYLEKGGFPEVLDASARIRTMIHQEYFKTILNRDIIERHDAMHPQAVIQLGHRLINSVSSLYTLNRLTEFLKSIGFKISKGFVAETLQWFHDAYFLLSVKMYSPSINKQNVNPRKVYCIDHAMVPSVSPGILVNSGHALENMAYLHLRRQTEHVYYYRTKKAREVDLIWVDDNGKKHPVQVAASLQDPKTKERELTALRECMEELHTKQGTVVTFEEEATIKDGSGAIQIVPAWKFLLQERS